jgi:DNA adenine methylase
VGGKKQLAPQLIGLFPKHVGTYYEPFLGGGVVFFNLISKKRFDYAVLNDFNEELMNVWRVVRDFPEELMDQIRKLPVSRDIFMELREKRPEEFSPVRRAARTVYLNKTGFNGLYRVNKAGKFNVPWGRYDSPTLFNEANILACSEALSHVKLMSKDFAEVVKDAGPGDLVYFDPPYVELSKTSNFQSYTSKGFSLDDQYRLAACFRELRERGSAVVASNSDTQLVRDLYKNWEIHEVQARRSINSKGDKRGPIGELIIVGRTR